MAITSAAAGELDVQVLLEVLTAYRDGDFSVRMPSTWTGLAGKVADTLNEVIGENQRFARELQRLAHSVGKEGRIGQRLFVGSARGDWAESRRAVDELVEDLVSPHVEVARVMEAVARGDLSLAVPMGVEGRALQGQFAHTARTVNTMVAQLNAFASEVTRVAREVGTEGKLGGQARVPGVSGVWKDLTDNVNSMAENLTAQVRNVAEVTTAVANGDLSKKVTVDVQGEILDLKSTINVMVDQLNAFASEVTRVAREVGTEGKLGGQAQVPGVSGIWKDLTDNVNQLAATLTNQIRAITNVATAVTQGDLTRSIGVAASGEVAVLKDKINEMIRNLRETTQRNAEQDWLKTNLARFTRMLQGQRDLTTACELVLSELVPLVGAQQGAFYTLDGAARDRSLLRLQATYAGHETRPRTFRVGEGLVGQCAASGERILITELPPGYVTISSGLGQAPPLALIVLPIAFEDQILGVLELASLQRFSPIHLDFLEQLTESIGIVLHTIEVNMRTQALLEQSQSLAYELQVQQEELRQTNEELQEKARLLAERNTEVERKNREVEQARRSLEEKAEQLALASQYKSQFLANMSHELRTPLNSLLILAQQLVENPEGNLNPKQVEFARIIHASGQDLLNLITDILDLSKIESGTVVLDVGEERFDRLARHLERSFRHLADSRQVAFEVSVDPDLPPTFRTDSKRLQQVLRNLLSNAFKFTERGRVELRIRLAGSGWDEAAGSLGRARRVVAFDVVDTGIGIPAEKQQTIFEAFQQADGTTSRKYGGTGLGLSISRELVHVLGGQIEVRSAVGVGSTFTVYLPLEDVSGTEPAGQGHAPETALPADGEEGGGTALGRAAVPDDRDRLAPGDAVVLVVDDDPGSCCLLLDLVHENGLKGVVATRGQDVLPLARAYRPAAVTLEVELRDGSGWEVLDALRSDPLLEPVPVAVVTGLDRAWERVRDREAIRFVAKPVTREALQPLFAELRRGEDGPWPDAPAPSSGPTEDAAWTEVQTHPDPALTGRTVLVADDDVRNVFALTAMLERYGLRVIPAEGGQQAVAALEAAEQVDLALLDVMMPDVDGYETIRRIRRDPRFAHLPIVALTAKAMKGDRERCLEAGASDYVAKPVEPSALLAILRSRLQPTP